MPHMAETEIMTLGRVRLGAFEPMLRSTWMEPRRITPQQPQNLLRVVALSGLGNTARLISGLGQVGESVIDPAMTSGSGATIIDPRPGDPVASLPWQPKWPWQKDAPVAVQIGTVLAAASLSVVSAAVAGYHGYRRDRSAMAGVGWAFVGALFPVVTPIVAFAQGYARPRGRR